MCRAGDLGDSLGKGQRPRSGQFIQLAAMSGLGQRGDGDFSDVFHVDKGLGDVADGQQQFALQDRFEKVRFAEVLAEPAAAQDGPFDAAVLHPDKSSIIRTLAERYNVESRRCIEEALGTVEDVQGLRAAYSGLLDLYYEIVLATPAMRDIWSGMQADKQLLELELQESRIAGGLLAEAMLRVYPDSDARQVQASAFLIWHLGEATMRLAISCAPEEGQGLVEAFKRMSLLEIMRQPV
jgi:hypothetical protein